MLGTLFSFFLSSLVLNPAPFSSQGSVHHSGTSPLSGAISTVPMYRRNVPVLEVTHQWAPFADLHHSDERSFLRFHPSDERLRFQSEKSTILFDGDSEMQAVNARDFSLDLVVVRVSQPIYVESVGVKSRNLPEQLSRFSSQLYNLPYNHFDLVQHTKAETAAQEDFRIGLPVGDLFRISFGAEESDGIWTHIKWSNREDERLFVDSKLRVPFGRIILVGREVGPPVLNPNSKLSGDRKGAEKEQVGESGLLVILQLQPRSSDNSDLNPTQ